MPSSLFAEVTPDSGTQERVVGQSSVNPAAAGVAKVVKVELRRRREIDVEVISRVFVLADRETDEGVRRAGGRQSRAVQVRRQERQRRRPPSGPTGLMKVAGAPASIAARSKANGCGPEIGCAGGVKDVHAHVIGVGPDREVRVIEEVRAKVEPVTVIGAGCIARG